MMYDDKDLDLAIKSDILKSSDVNAFRLFIAKNSDSDSPDEENFRLITSFNDIFVTIAIILSLVSVGWIFGSIGQRIGFIAISLVSWGFAELFTKKRRMALPSIILAFTFLMGIFGAISPINSSAPIPNSYLNEIAHLNTMIAGVITTICSLVYWKRFKTPIVVAYGVASLFLFFLSVMLYTFPKFTLEWISLIIVCSGVLIFFIAMYWDTQDIKRTSYKSDVAFWIHLLSAPLIIFPIFNSIINFSKTLSISEVIYSIGIYIIFSIISLIIDRRPFMLSSLFYLLYAIDDLLKRFGIIELRFAIAAFSISTSLLILAVFWKCFRAFLVKLIPIFLQNKVPSIR
ncbi:MAG: hypothetical protein ACI8ZF_000709 [Candidatus Midichloriaceae bacterium]|jgi:hypothetical protein